MIILKLFVMVFLLAVSVTCLRIAYYVHTGREFTLFKRLVVRPIPGQPNKIEIGLRKAKH